MTISYEILILLTILGISLGLGLGIGLYNKKGTGVNAGLRSVATTNTTPYNMGTCNERFWKACKFRFNECQWSHRVGEADDKGFIWGKGLKTNQTAGAWSAVHIPMTASAKTLEQIKFFFSAFENPPNIVPGNLFYVQCCGGTNEGCPFINVILKLTGL